MIGRPVRRREDLRFLTGRGRYVADLALDRTAHVAVVRSQHAHARILRVDASAAQALSGVLGVFTLGDLPELRGALPPPVVPGVAVKPYRQSALADGVVRFAGEPIAVAARWDVTTASLHVWSSTQMPYGVRQRIAEALGLAPDAVRVTAPDVGGGFGAKGPVYPEELLVATLARRLGRPVCWNDTRSGSFLSTTHAGDQLHTATLALAGDGTILGLADDFLIDAGAYLPRGAVVAGVTAAHLVGLYRVPAFRCRLGLKGTGEGSAVPGPAAIANAVADALGPGCPEIIAVPIRARELARPS